MKIFMIKHNDELNRHIAECFEQCGQEVLSFSFPEPVDTYDFTTLSEANRRALNDALDSNVYDVIFSIEYIHEVSMIANSRGIIYLSWIIYLPNPDLYRRSVSNVCNAFFVFDTELIDMLKSAGADNVYYLPAGAIVAQGMEEQLSDTEKIYDVSFVGKIDNDIKNDNIFDTSSLLTDKCRGYIEGMALCQRNIYGRNIILGNIPGFVKDEISEKYPVSAPIDVYANLDELIYYKYFGPYCTLKERSVLLGNMKHNNINDITVFAAEDLKELESKGLQTREYISGLSAFELSERRKIYAQSKINFYVADRAVCNGIPHQCFDIMAAGGLLLTNRNDDILKHFTQEKELVTFSSEAEMIYYTKKYLENESERREIAENGYRKVHKEHTVMHRIQELLSVF